MYLLYGFTTFQAYIYSVSFNDTVLVKFAAYSMWLLDTLHMWFVSNAMYLWMVGVIADDKTLGNGSGSLLAASAVNVAITSIVQTHFAYKAVRSCNPPWTWVFATFMGTLIILSTYMGLQISMPASVGDDITHIDSPASQAMVSSLFVTAACNGVISLVLAVLPNEKSTSISREDATIHKLVVKASEKHLPLTFATGFQLGWMSVYPNSAWPFFLNLVVGQVAANSLLATLNARKSILAIKPPQDILNLPDAKTTWKN